MARDVMGALDYREWTKFRQLIERAKMSCEMAGHFSNNHFVLKAEMVPIGSGAKRERELCA
jgi:DNA-damage-inducible protein D